MIKISHCLFLILLYRKKQLTFFKFKINFLFFKQYCYNWIVKRSNFWPVNVLRLIFAWCNIENWHSMLSRLQFLFFKIWLLLFFGINRNYWLIVLLNWFRLNRLLNCNLRDCIIFNSVINFTFDIICLTSLNIIVHY